MSSQACLGPTLAAPMTDLLNSRLTSPCCWKLGLSARECLLMDYTARTQASRGASVAFCCQSATACRLTSRSAAKSVGPSAGHWLLPIDDAWAHTQSTAADARGRLLHRGLCELSRPRARQSDTMRVCARAAEPCQYPHICTLLLAAAALLAHVPATSALCSGRWAAAGGSSRDLIISLKVQPQRCLLPTCIMLHAGSIVLFCSMAGLTLLGCFHTQDAADLAQLRLICTSDAAEFNANRAYAGLDQHCHMPAVCRHIYEHALIGVRCTKTRVGIHVVSSKILLGCALCLALQLFCMHRLKLMYRVQEWLASSAVSSSAPWRAAYHPARCFPAKPTERCSELRDSRLTGSAMSRASSLLTALAWMLLLADGCCMPGPGAPAGGRHFVQQLPACPLAADCGAPPPRAP